MTPAFALMLVGVAIAAVVVLVLVVRLPAFLTLLLVAIATGIAAGADPMAVLDAVRKGFGDTLGTVAVVVGLGAMFGAMLEASGGIGAVARALLDRFGERYAPWAMALVGVLVGIPLFFDVAFVILAPLVTTIARRADRRVVYFATPLLIGLSMMHAVVPPHPGPVAASVVLHVETGRLAIWGLVCGLPAVVIAGPLLTYLIEGKPGLGRYAPPPMLDEDAPAAAPIGLLTALLLMLVPLGLILLGGVAQAMGVGGRAGEALRFAGNPFVALLVACLLVWARLGLAGTPRPVLAKIMGRALEPAGVISLVVGAGAAFKEVLIDSGAGGHVAGAIAAMQVSPLLFGFLVSTIVRVAQGSATVATVTAAGLAAPIVAAAGLGPDHVALVAIAIGAGSIVISHVNDAGFWLVTQYLGLKESQTFRTWTLGSTVGGLVIFAMTLLLWPLLPA
jgi:gluconate transporter